MKPFLASKYQPGLMSLFAAFIFIASAPNAAAKDITFQDIYAAPDNADLNLAYANQEIAKGELLSAAGALERLLLSQPDLDSVRLLYAKVLYMLDDKQGSMRELDVLKARSLSAENSETWKLLNDKIAKSSR
jgi:predicted Zn-dependent protease